MCGNKVVVVGGGGDCYFPSCLIFFCFCFCFCFCFLFFSAKTGEGVDELFLNIVKYAMGDAYPQPPTMARNVKRACS